MQALPVKFVCPLCSGLSHVFDSPHTDGHHIFCEKCRFAGSATDLVQRKASPTPDSKLWRSCRSRLAGTALNAQAESSATRYVIDPRNTRQTAEWNLRTGKLIGLISNDELKQKFDRGLRHVQPPVWQDARLLASERLFRGQQPKSFRGRSASEQMLVLPASFLPGKLCGFHVSFGRGNLDQRGYFPLDPSSTEGGLLWLEQILALGSAHIVAVADPWFAVRLQAQHLASRNRPLPLTAWTATLKASTRLAWQCVAHRKVVVWTPELNWQVFQQSMPANSDIACLRSHSNNFFPTSYPGLLELSPEVRLAAAVSAAVPWQTAAEQHVRRSSPDELFQLAMQIKQDETAGEEFMRSLPFKLANRLFATLPPERNRMRVSIGNSTYEKCSEGIFVLLPDGTRSLVLNLDVRITAHFMFRRDSYLVFELKLPGGGKHATQFAFSVLEPEARDYLVSILRNKCSELGLPPLVASDDRHSERLVAILLGLGRVPSQILPSQLGWDDNLRLLVLPRHTLRLGGEILRSEPLSPLAKLNPVTSSRPSESEFLMLQKQPELACLLAAVATRLLEPALFPRTTTPVRFIGFGLEFLANLLRERLGIYETNALQGAHWPQYVPEEGQLILTLDETAELSNPGRTLSADWRAVATAVMPNLANMLLYGLQQVMKTNFDLPEGEDCYTFVLDCYYKKIKEIENDNLQM